MLSNVPADGRFSKMKGKLIYRYKNTFLSDNNKIKVK